MIIDRFNTNLIVALKLCTNELLKLEQTEGGIMAQKDKVDWLQQGDGNDAYSMLLSRIKQDKEEFVCWKGVMAKCSILNLTLNKRWLNSIPIWWELEVMYLLVWILLLFEGEKLLDGRRLEV